MDSAALFSCGWIIVTLVGICSGLLLSIVNALAPSARMGLISHEIARSRDTSSFRRPVENGIDKTV